MNIDFSTGLSIASLVIALLSYRHSIKTSQSTSSQIETHLQLTSNFALNQANQKYVDLLSDIKREFQEIVKELEKPALKGNREVSELLHSYDKLNNEYPTLSICFNDVVSVIRDAFDKELTYQYGSNLSHQLLFIKHLKYQKKNNARKKAKFFSLFQKEYINKPIDYLGSSNKFWDSLEELYKRISDEDEGKIYREAILNGSIEPPRFYRRVFCLSHATVSSAFV